MKKNIWAIQQEEIGLCAEEKRKIHIAMIYETLYKLISTYDETDGFNKIPKFDRKKKKNSDPVSYYEEWLNTIEKEAYMLFLFEPKYIMRNIRKIIKETRYFVTSYEILGVVDSWIEANPNIKFYESVYAFCEEISYKKLYEGVEKGLFRFLPTRQEYSEYLEYFSAIKKEKDECNFKFSDAKYYQDEVLKALTEIFRIRFSQYLS